MENQGMILRLFSLEGNFITIQKIEVQTFDEAKAIVAKHIEGSGYRNLQYVDDEDGYTTRFTATTPNGRPGRNVASIHF